MKLGAGVPAPAGTRKPGQSAHAKSKTQGVFLRNLASGEVGHLRLLFLVLYSINKLSRYETSVSKKTTIQQSKAIAKDDNRVQ